MVSAIAEYIYSNDAPSAEGHRTFVLAVANVQMRMIPRNAVLRHIRASPFPSCIASPARSVG